jgi:3-isopropylmalate/(R)-2-methylmalate dehydratase small subunit
LNRPEVRGASILVVGRNFGCGSSREHAVWAIAQAGYRAVIAPGKDEGFADIFEANAYNNGLLPIELPEPLWKAIVREASENPGTEATIDLGNQTLALHLADGSSVEYSFEVSENQRQRLLKGLDAIAETMLVDDQIRRHEQRSPTWMTPVLSGAKPPSTP